MDPNPDPESQKHADPANLDPVPDPDPQHCNKHILSLPDIGFRAIVRHCCSAHVHPESVPSKKFSNILPWCCTSYPVPNYIYVSNTVQLDRMCWMDVF